MDHTRKQAVKWFVLMATALSGQTRDPTDMLAAARDRLLAMRAPLSKISCTVTIDRSYFARANPPERARSCDQIAADRKKRRYKLNLYATDRIRLKMLFVGGREVFSWVEPLKFESHSLDDVLLTGPIGTGGLGTFYLRLFEDPATRFEYLGEKSGKIEYGFRQSSEASHHTILAGDSWLAAAQSGSFLIDPATLELERFSLETSTLPPETGMCETSSTIDYQRARIGEDDVLVPGRGESLNVLINTQETTNAAAYSSCTPDIPKNEPPSGGLPVVPEKYGVQLALNDAIDTGTAAAGDLITATVSKDVVSRDGIAILLRKGTRVRGRILNLARWIENGKDPYFVIAISFDEADIDGVASPFRVKLDRSLMAVALGNDSSRWPENSLVFGTRAERYQVPRGFESWWMTIR